MATAAHSQVWAAFWRTLTKVDASKLRYQIALRNAIAVALPLAAGIALHNPLGGVAIATGALNVSYSDGTDPYKHRAARMLGWTLLGGAAVFLGSATGRFHLLAIAVAAGWAFVAGLGVAVSPKIGDLGLNTLVALIVFAARGALDLRGAAIAGLLVVTGGLLQTGLALLFWPLRRTEPERLAVAGVYASLAEEVNPDNHRELSSPLASIGAPVQETMDALSREHTTEADRLRLLFDQADRIRMSCYVLVRLREEETNRREGIRAAINCLLAAAARTVDLISGEVTSCKPSLQRRVPLAETQAVLSAARDENYGRELVSAMNVLAGQVRVAADLAKALTGDMAEYPELRPASLPWRIRWTWISKMRSNLDWQSTYFRHAIRMAALVAAADTIGRAVSWQRSYWLPMTVAVVLKPDFVTTYARGVLRLSGTFAGLLLATLLYYVMPKSSHQEIAITQMLLVGAFTFALRSIGTTNYGAFSLSVSGLIVFLVAATGVPPMDVVFQRALNTVAGGLLALAGYALWPSWERTRAGDVLALMLDRSRDYFRQSSLKLLRQETVPDEKLNELRAQWRVARANTEATVDRMSAEPQVDPAQLTCLTSLLASSHAVMHAMVALEAGTAESKAAVPEEEFASFARDVEFTLYYVAAALRGSSAASSALPHLRDDHSRLAAARDRLGLPDEFILSETDRLTVSLNTLREQAMRCVGAAQTP